MKMLSVVKHGERFVHDNAPTILAGVAIVGTGATGFLSARGMIRAQERVFQHDLKNGHNRGVAKHTPTEIAKLTWMEFAPAVGAAGVTITAIICAHRITAGRAAALAAAYSLSEKKLSEYKGKIEEKLGIEKKQEIEDDIAKDQMKKAPSAEFVILGGDDVLCFDAYSGRYFKSSMEAIRQAMNNTNFEAIHHNYATLEFFWNEIGLDPTAYSDEFGWDANLPLHVRFATTMSGDDKPALVVNYDVKPVRHYNPIYS